MSTYYLPQDAERVAAGGREVFFLQDGHVRSVDSSGNVSSHGDIANGKRVSGFVVSPDGTQWVWGTQEPKADGSITSRTFIAGTSGKRTLLLEETSDEPVVITPTLWSPRGSS
ncbi:MAG: hypothetical protein ABR548_12430 [Actinomycetota bacterium]